MARKFVIGFIYIIVAILFKLFRFELLHGYEMIIPFILGLIPSLFGFLAAKTGNKIFRKIYEIINFII